MVSGICLIIFIKTEKEVGSIFL
jgi:hypothetical protein